MAQSRPATPCRGPDIEHPDDAGIIERLIDGLGSGDGIAELLDQFRNAGAEESVESWISNGPNRPLTPEEVRAAIGDDTLGALSLQTGLAEEELLNRIARELPPTIDRMTPSGSLPAAAESSTIEEDHIEGELMETCHLLVAITTQQAKRKACCFNHVPMVATPAPVMRAKM